MSASIKSVQEARVGDTITLAAGPQSASEPLPGYTEAKPMVFCGLFPCDSDQFPDLRDALERLQLNDAALAFEPETSSAMGFGFRCGFLGLLHMEIVQERLEREYDLDLITTAPSVVYHVKTNNGEILEIDNPAQLPGPDRRESIAEPYVKLDVFVPKEYVGAIMELAVQRRGEFKDMQYVTEDRTQLEFEMPLAEVVTDFFDQLKSCSRGYASMEYEVLGYRKNKLVKLDVKLNGEEVDPLAVIVHVDDAYRIGRALCVKLKEFIPRQQFRVPIQACIGAKVIAAQQTRLCARTYLLSATAGISLGRRNFCRSKPKGKSA